MRRKSERSTSKKDKSSPDKKLDKSKRTKRGRRKQSSTSSENETVNDSNPVQKMESTSEVPKNPPPTPAKEDSSEDAQDQVWRVKATEGSGDVGEIQKLKICLTRPPSTPERVDRSPRSKRKHSRGTSSSDTISVEGVDDKKKMKHRSKKSHESKDDKSIDSQGEDPDPETEVQQDSENSNNDVSQSGMLSEKVAKDSDTAEASVSTTDEGVNNETEVEKNSTEQEEKKEYSNESESQKPSSVDTVVSANCESKVIPPVAPEQDSNAILNKISPVRQRSLSVDKSEILEIHAEESKCESSDYEVAAKPKGDLKDDQMAPEDASTERKVSNIEEIVSKESNSAISSNISNKTDVVETSENNNTEKRRKSIENYELQKENVLKEIKITNENHSQGLEHSDSIVSNQETFATGQPTPVPTRKRRWGSRSTKLSKQRSITISTDVLKEIIPDVKPAEFDEVIEEKKHKRIEMHDKPERPILPKIVIDNTENFGNNKDYHGPKQYEEKERDHKSKESQLATNRKISIVKDNDSILARPPSPPRNKQSCILFITNLVRPFTLPQLKNLLQRTGRIEENGFWIDRIKSKCFVKYETEDQAVETRHALHGVTWPVSNPKSLQVDFSTQEAFDKAKLNEETDGAPVSTIPGTVEDWLREQDLKRERGELEKPWERKLSTREWDLGKNEKDKEKDKMRRDDHPMDKRRHRSLEKSPEPARKFKKKEEEAPAKLLDDLFRKTKTTPCIYWLPLSAETIAIKEEQRRQHMAEHERRLQELRRTQRRH